jgi:hypothetical protein
MKQEEAWNTLALSLPAIFSWNSTATALTSKGQPPLTRPRRSFSSTSTLLNAPLLSPSTVEALKSWFFNNTSGTKHTDQRIPRIFGASESTYNSIQDLAALRVPSDQDRLSNFIQNNFALPFKTYSVDGKTLYISEHSISRFVAILSTVLAAIMLFGPIISLHIVKNPHALLGILSGWTVLFAACVGLLTNARRDQ